jgi:tetratricopeptide (TPR) repeat protein
MTHRLLLCSLLMLFLLPALSAQQSATDLKKKARELLGQGKYTEAKATLSNSRELVRDDKEGRFLLAVCNYHLHLLDEAFTQLKALGDNERYPFPECRLYLGKIYHARHEFAEAGRHYKKYLKTLSASNPLRRAVWNEVRRCQNGLDLQYKTAPAFVENLGPGVNTAGDEFGPVPSPTYIDRLYFSSIRQGNSGGRRDERGNPDETNGRYFSDIFSSRLIGGKWTQTQPLPYSVNSPRHEVLVDINNNGNALIFFKGLTLQKGEILVDTFRQGGPQALTSDPFMGPINALEGEVSFHVFNDTLVFFSSQRAGGFGGFDLYKSSWREGRWTAPENLGPEVNSAFDETAPFLLRDGRSLFFSSNNSAGSIGGFDIFKSIWNPLTKKWSAPENLGMPVNSAADDSHFRVSRDGFSAYFSSSRKDGFGLRDIYVAYFNDFLELDPIVSYSAPSPPPVQTPPTSTPTVTTTPAVATTPAITAPTTPAPSTPAPSTPAPVLETQPRTAEAPVSNVLAGAQSLAASDARYADWIQAAAVFMKSNPDAKVSISAYVKDTQPPGTALFAGVRTAEAASAQLQRQGIAADRIFIRAVPAAWTDAAAGTHSLALRWLPAPGKTAPEFSPLKKSLPSATYNDAYEAPLLYKVQITSLKGEYKGDLLTRHPDAMVEKSHGVDFYRYTVGAFTAYAEAEKFRRQLVAQGQTSAYITAYVHGFRLERGPARAYTSAFPDLRGYAGN